MKNSNENRIFVSHITLRRTIGILGISLPFVVVFIAAFFSGVGYDCTEIQSSISHYYHTPARGFLVAFIGAIAVCLFAYRGYKGDNWAGDLACYAGLGVAFFPTSSSISDCLYPDRIDDAFVNVVSDIHLACAVIFFIMLSYFCLFLFKKTKIKGQETKRKKKRNFVYTICGIIMLICMVFMALYIKYFRNEFPHWEQHHPLFWLESIALWAFGISWIVKGEWLLVDSNIKKDQ